MPYSDELLIDRLTRIADALERIATGLERHPLTFTDAKSPPTVPQKPSEEEYVNEKRAAEITSMSCSWFQGKRVEGGGPPYTKVGNAVRYRLSDLHAWFALHRVKHSAEWYERKGKLEF